MSKQTKVTAAALANAFLSRAEHDVKIAPMVREYIGDATGAALETAKGEVTALIREKAGRNDKGNLKSVDGLKKDGSAIALKVLAAWAAARQEFSRIVRRRDAQGRGKIERLSAPQKAYNVAFDAKASLQKMENCPVDLVAAFDAVMSKAVTLGAVAKVAK